ncbi:hypothetical protein DFP73DRAFT_396427 [Morchella snyderi]|nr:hypothetical protein DFP73DRAFT_396427 [Morchella snyderi]
MAVPTHPCPFGEKSQDPNHQCKRIRKSKKLLRRHIRREHIKHLHCDRCSKRFGNKFERDRHTNMERACKSVKPEAPVPQYVADLASHFESCKFSNWNDLLFENGRPKYDYQADLGIRAEPHGSIDSISIFSSPATELTSSEDHPNEPRLSTVSHRLQRMNLYDDHSMENRGHTEPARPNGISIASTGAPVGGPYTIRPTTEAASSEAYGPSPPLENDPEGPSDDHYDDDDDDCNEADYDKKLDIGVTGFRGPFQLRNNPDDDVRESDHTTSATETMDFCDFDPSLGEYSNLARGGATFSDFRYPPEFCLGELAFDDGQETWNDFDDILGLPINPTAGEPSPEDNVTGPASVVPQYMYMGQCDVRAEQKSLVADSEQQACDHPTSPVGYLMGPQKPYKDLYHNSNPHIDQFHNHNSGPSAGVRPKDLVRDVDYWAVEWLVDCLIV